MDGLLHMAAAAGLLIQNTNTTGHIRVGGAFANVKVIKTFFGVIQLFRLIQSCGMELCQGAGQFKIALGCQRVIATGDPRLEKIGAVGAHFMKIPQDLW